ncbi:hypothetical protein FRB93_002354 [Tulasnella sp. JGI-2019a]|nr:hypothetical protein FRB93_002354 [Tulasnella sp. JGI-2019a]
MTTLKYTIVDAFTSSPFSGNPAAVVILPTSTTLPDSLAQNIATEFNLSETAFVIPKEPGSNDKDGIGTAHSQTYALRWFTPRNEVPLCGHATLATARVLFADRSLVPESATSLRFESLSGVLTADRVPGTRMIELDFPAAKLVGVDSEEKEKVARIVNEAVGETSLNILDVQKAGRYMVVRLGVGFDLENATVNAEPFAIFAATGTRGTILTSERSSRLAPAARFISRMFAPVSGVPEDPVTGAAHCLLVPYWSKILGIPTGEAFAARQASPRGGNLSLVWDEDKGRVKLQGDAVVVAQGEMYFPLSG